MRYRGLSSIVFAVALSVASFGCGSGSDAASPEQPVNRPVVRTVEAPDVSPAARSQRPRVVALGDSLTAGLGIEIYQAYPALLQQRIDDAGLNYEVVNAGVSGDTTAAGLSRLDWALDGDVRVLIVALGGNDGLRGLSAEQLRSNLAKIIEGGQKRGATVILAGMEAPPNFGRSYFVSFHRVYPELAKQYGVALVPFLLEGVAGIETLNQRDGIHPTPEGARIVADNVWTALAPALKKLGQ